MWAENIQRTAPLIVRSLHSVRRRAPSSNRGSRSTEILILCEFQKSTAAIFYCQYSQACFTRSIVISVDPSNLSIDRVCRASSRSSDGLSGRSSVPTAVAPSQTSACLIRKGQVELIYIAGVAFPRRLLERIPSNFAQLLLLHFETGSFEAVSPSWHSPQNSLFEVVAFPE